MHTLRQLSLRVVSTIALASVSCSYAASDPVIDAAIRDLRSESSDARDAAHQKLLALGERALPDCRRALELESDAEARARLLAICEEVEQSLRLRKLQESWSERWYITRRDNELVGWRRTSAKLVRNGNEMHWRFTFTYENCLDGGERTICTASIDSLTNDNLSPSVIEWRVERPPGTVELSQRICFTADLIEVAVLDGRNKRLDLNKGESKQLSRSSTPSTSLTSGLLTPYLIEIQSIRKTTSVTRSEFSQEDPTRELQVTTEAIGVEECIDQGKSISALVYKDAQSVEAGKFWIGPDGQMFREQVYGLSTTMSDEESVKRVKMEIQDRENDK